MKKVLTNIKTVIILILVGIIALMTIFDKGVECPECDTFDTASFVASLPIVYDTIHYEPIHDTIFKNINHYIDKEIVVEIPANIDSLKVARAFYSEYMVTDTILNDTNGLIVVTDYINQNRIQKRKVYPKVLYPSYKIVTEYKPYKERIKLYAGIGVVGSMNRFGFTANVLLATKKEQMYGLSYDIINKDIAFSMYWKLKFKR